ncbi:MAG: hypothetical protein ACYDBY_03455 [Thermoanaerobaculia bacterium]
MIFTKVVPSGRGVKTHSTGVGKSMRIRRSRSKPLTVTGIVKAVQTGRSMTLVLPNKSSVEYILDASSVVPAELAIGNTVTVVTTTTTTGAPGVAKSVTISKQTTTTKTTAAKKP